MYCAGTCTHEAGSETCIASGRAVICTVRPVKSCFPVRLRMGHNIMSRHDRTGRNHTNYMYSTYLDTGVNWKLGRAMLLLHVSKRKDSGF